MKLVSYKMGSQSAKDLANALGIKRLKHEGRPLRVRDTLINWGCSNIPDRIEWTGQILNHPSAVSRAANKLKAFQLFDENEIECPAWTTNKEYAAVWLIEGNTVVCRTILNGHSGQGIVLANKREEIVDAPLYTFYVKKDQEYRLHVSGDKVFFVQRKARKKEVPDDQVNWQIRNHQNGFIYANQDVEVSDAMKNTAVAAVEALGLDFGAVDMLTTKQGDHAVLEVNTACGLAGTTLDKYVEMIKGYL